MKWKKARHSTTDADIVAIQCEIYREEQDIKVNIIKLNTRLNIRYVYAWKKFTEDIPKHIQNVFIRILNHTTGLNKL